MPDALTTTQVEILRRARADGDILKGPYLTGLLSDALFLAKIGLLNWEGSSLFRPSPLGAEYLHSVEVELAKKGSVDSQDESTPDRILAGSQVPGQMTALSNPGPVV